MSDFSGKQIILLGAAGQGMRGLATLLVANGAHVYGIDNDFLAPNSIIADDIDTIGEQELPDIIKRCDEIIYSDALTEDHPWRIAAQESSAKISSLFAAIGRLSHSYQTIAVAGTHGKSSTTAMLAHIMIAAGLDPTVLVGASIAAWGNKNARSGQSKMFIVEADEYQNHFLHLRPTAAIITALDLDHTDFFADKNAVIDSFSKFIALLPATGALAVPAELLTDKAWRLPWPHKTIAVPSPEQPLSLVLPGAHMQMNANLAIAIATLFGVAKQAAIKYLATFSGLGRRFEKIGNWQGIDLISDYAHHPTEIAATILAAHEIYGARKLLVVLEPHTQERLNAFFDNFLTSLLPSDMVIVTPVFQARHSKSSKKDRTVSELVDGLKMRGTPALELRNYDDLKDTLVVNKSKYAAIVVFSAGRMDKELRELIIRL